MHVGAVDRSMTTSAPASALTQKSGVWRSADVDFSLCAILGLSVALQAKVGIAFYQQFAVEGAMRIMTDGAAFTKRFMFEHKRTRLLPVTLGAGLILSCH